MKEIIHFAHGNGFPSSCYKQLLGGLEGDYEVKFIDRIGHNPLFPITENWHFLVDEVIDSIKKQSSKPVIAIGHSLGGVLSAVACVEHPEYFKAVILLDSPLLGKFKSNMIRLAKSLGIIDRVTPARRTKSRRQYWQDKESLIQYLKSRQLFKTFDERCLNDYIDFGLDLKQDGYYLRFDKHIEYLIYRTLPHQLPQYRGQLTKPAAVIYGEHSDIVGRQDIKNMRKNYQMKSFCIKGGHMFPMEYPDIAAEKIKLAIEAIL